MVHNLFAVVLDPETSLWFTRDSLLLGMFGQRGQQCSFQMIAKPPSAAIDMIFVGLKGGKHDLSGA